MGAVVAAMPRVWVVASHRMLTNEHGKQQPYTLVDEGGLRACLAFGLQPVSYPCVPPGSVGSLLDGVQGVFMGGSATNVDPRHYGEAPARVGMDFDPEREAVSFELVRLCTQRGLPLMGVCRGSHEINVALGGSLHQDLQSLHGPVVHWEDPQETLQQQYAERHPVRLVADGALARMTGCRSFGASSLHSQGVRQLAEGLVAEAFADDGLVESFRWHDLSQFAWGFQFHPEWGHEHHPAYAAIMTAYRAACQAQL